MKKLIAILELKHGNLYFEYSTYQQREASNIKMLEVNLENEMYSDYIESNQLDLFDSSVGLSEKEKIQQLLSLPSGFDKNTKITWEIKQTDNITFEDLQ